MKNYHIASEKINPEASRYPYCIVWTPIPVLSWLLPFIGHMGICTSTGVIRDFAGPYFVSVNKPLDVLAGSDSSVSIGGKTVIGYITLPRLGSRCREGCLFRLTIGTLDDPLR
ncbi:transmembrane protein 222-like protein [Lates japonicus]|uniref:Transmembrane protein 222-like protein n=1 Tax=Lates japonicus TaxID=270547 RepID=A0AAD3MQE0_LATJO|nr:transmembrane protein 222-like protein [Lates japonicus]